MHDYFSPYASLIANVVLILAYMLMATEKIPRVAIALLGAMTVIVCGVLDQDTAVHYVDWNVIFLLVGMMIMVNVLKHTGTIRWLGLYAVKKSNGSGTRMMITLALLTAVLSAFLDNVTTVLLLGSVTCAVASQLRINPVPFLITQAIASNIGGTATLIGDPPNIMIGSAAHLGFEMFLEHLAPVVLIILPVSIVVMYWMYKDQLKLSAGTKDAIGQLSTEGVITDPALMIKSLVVMALVMTGFLFHSKLGLEAGTIALARASVLLLFENSKHIWDDVEWTSVFFFIGLFIIVGAVQEVGTIRYLSQWLVSATRGSETVVTMALLWGSGLLSALIDNIPYTATMIPLIKSIEAAQHYPNVEPLWWALALGACLGGNGTLIGATANIVVADMANRHGHPIRFLEFMRAGVAVMVVSLAIASLYLWAIWLR